MQTLLVTYKRIKFNNINIKQISISDKCSKCCFMLGFLCENELT
jgi:hypothetical protein